MATISGVARRRGQVSPTASVVVLSLGALDFGVEASIVLPALPALARRYHASFAGIGWFAVAFQVVAVAAVPLLGRLGDVVGKRRVLLWALMAFAAGSLLCAITHSIGLAIAGRAIQGLGGAVAPLGLAVARDTLPRARLPRTIGVLAGAATFSGAIGFLLSGLLVDKFSPAALFWFLFVFAVLVLALTFAYVQESPERAPGYVDLAGALLASTGLGGLLLAISEGNNWGWASSRVVGLFIAAAALLAMFAAVEARVSKPLLDLSLLARRPNGNANLCALLFGFAFFLSAYVVPQIAARPEASGYGLGFSTTKIGLLLTPACVFGGGAGWVAGRLVDRVGPRVLVSVGSALGLAAYLSLALDHGNVAALAGGTAVTGVSWGLILTGIHAVVMRNVAAHTSGVAAAVIAATRITGTAVGAQAAFAVIAASGAVGAFPAEAGFTRAFVMAALGAGATLVAATFLPGRRRSSSTPERSQSVEH